MRRTRPLLLAVLLAVTATLGGQAAAHAATALRPTPQLTPAAPDGLTRQLRSGAVTPATYALLRAQSLFRPAVVARRVGRRSRTDPREATLILRDLVARYNRLSTAQKRQADVILARPTDGNSDPQGDGYSVPEHSPARLRPNICIALGLGPRPMRRPRTDANTNGIPDYVETALTVAENVWNTEVGTHGLPRPAERRDVRE